MGEFPFVCVPRAETRLCVLAARGFATGGYSEDPLDTEPVFN
jgi:hypothetical protein